MGRSNKSNDEKILELFAQERWDYQAPVYDMGSPDSGNVQIRPDKTVSLGNFKPDPLIPGGYTAHPTTIRAMKKDIFVAGNDSEITEIPYICEGCKRQLDIQFWNFCPYCEGKIPQI